MVEQQKNTLISQIESLIDSGEIEKAKENVIEILKILPDDEHFLYQLSNIEFMLGNCHKAVYILKSIKSFELTELIERAISEYLMYAHRNAIEEKLLTVAYIVKNEEKHLPKSLRSIQSIADEIIVVDTGSTDSTIRIAEDFGAKVYHFNWANDYSAARNVSIMHATGKWVLYLDADEVIQNSDLLSIVNSLKRSDEKVGGFIFEIISKYYNDYGKESTHSGRYPRLFRNLGYPIIYFFGKVHEQISTSLIEKGYEMKESNFKILHMGYAISQTEMSLKLSKRLKILTDHVVEEPTNGYAWYHAGNTFFQMKMYQETIQFLENALKCKNLSPYLSANTCLIISKSYEAVGDLKSALHYSTLSGNYLSNYRPALDRSNYLMGLLLNKI